MVIRIIWVIVFELFWISGFGQACCSGGTPLSSNLGIQSLENKYLQLQLSYDYNTQRDLVLGSRQLEDDSRHRDTHSILLRASYAFAARWSITGLFSLVRQEENVFRSTGNFTTAAQGIGDVVGLVQYSVFQSQNTAVVAAGGLKFPIGVTNRLDDRTGILLNPDLQPGTGALDWIFGLHLGQNHFIKTNLTAFITSTYRLTTKDDRFGGQQIYEFGDEWISQIGFRDRYFAGSFLLDPSILFKYRYTQKDKVETSFVPNTSGHWLHLVPAIDFAFTPEFALGFSYEFPIYRSLQGTQLTTSRKITVSLNYTFKVKEKFEGINEMDRSF